MSVMVNQMLTYPSRDTVENLQALFATSPFDIDLRHAFVEINSSTYDQDDPDESAIYVATPGTMKEYYDAGIGSSTLILPLESEALMLRCQTLREAAPSCFYGDLYYPHMILKYHMPPRSRHIRGFVNSVSTVLATMNEFPIILAGEVMVTREFHAIPDAEYYASQIAASPGTHRLTTGVPIQQVIPPNV